MNNLLKDFGEYISDLRVKSGYTSQRQFAKVTGISNGTIARIEDGTTKARPETLKKLSNSLIGTSYDDLLKQLGYIEDFEKEKDRDEYISHIKKVDSANLFIYLYFHLKDTEKINFIANTFNDYLLGLKLDVESPFDILNHFLRTDDQDLIKEFHRVLLNNYLDKKNDVNFKPILSYLNTDLITNFFVVPDNKMKHYGLKIGSLIIYEEIVEVHNQDIIVLLLKKSNRIITRKVLANSNGLTLLSDSHNEDPFFVDENECEIIGKVVHSFNTIF